MSQNLKYYCDGDKCYIDNSQTNEQKFNDQRQQLYQETRQQYQQPYSQPYSQPYQQSYHQQFQQPYPQQFQQPYPQHFQQPYPQQFQQTYPQQFQQPYSQQLRQPNSQQFQQPYSQPYSQQFQQPYSQTYLQQNQNILSRFRGGNVIINSKYENIDSNNLNNNKLVGFLFASSQCGPCMKFTPLLKNYYTQVKRNDPNNFEIVLVTGDNQKSEFESYFNSCKWYAIPFGSSNNENLRNEFKIKSYPTLIIVDTQTGRIVDNNGVETIRNNNNYDLVYKHWNK